jgi:hypothetical protein
MFTPRVKSGGTLEVANIPNSGLNATHSINGIFAGRLLSE